MSCYIFILFTRFKLNLTLLSQDDWRRDQGCQTAAADGRVRAHTAAESTAGF